MDRRAVIYKHFSKLDSLDKVLSLRSFCPANIDKRVKNTEAVYFLVEAKKIKYIGCSTKLVSRWKTHHLKPLLNIDESPRVYYYRTEKQIIKEVEAELIQHHNPIYNLTLNLKASSTFQTLSDDSIKLLMKILGVTKESLAVLFTCTPGWINRAINGTNKRVRQRVVKHLYTLFIDSISDHPRKEVEIASKDGTTTNISLPIVY